MKSGEIRVNESMILQGESIVDVLFDHYFDNKKADEPNIELAYKDFCHSLLDVDPFQIDEIMSAAAALCMEHERAGFMTGVKMCHQLLIELSE